MTVTYGFMQTPNVPRALTLAAGAGPDASSMMETSYLPRPRDAGAERHAAAVGLAGALFILWPKNATSATDFFCIPTDRVVELGAQVPI